MKDALKYGLLAVGGWLLYRQMAGGPGSTPAAQASPTKALVAAAARATLLNADEWNYYYTQVRGEGAPDPLDVWPQRDRSLRMTVDEWWEGVSKKGVLGLAPPRYLRVS